MQDRPMFIVTINVSEEPGRANPPFTLHPRPTSVISLARAANVPPRKTEIPWFSEAARSSARITQVVAFSFFFFLLLQLGAFPNSSKKNYFNLSPIARCALVLPRKREHTTWRTTYGFVYERKPVTVTLGLLTLKVPIGETMRVG